MVEFVGLERERGGGKLGFERLRNGRVGGFYLGENMGL